MFQPYSQKIQRRVLWQDVSLVFIDWKEKLFYLMESFFENCVSHVLQQNFCTPKIQLVRTKPETFLKSNLTIVYVYLRDDDVARFHFFKSHPTD